MKVFSSPFVLWQRNSNMMQPSRLAAVISAAVILGFPLVGRSEEAAAKAADTPAIEKPAPEPTNDLPYEIRCCDGSLLRVQLLDATIALKTEYGTIKVPVADIQKIDFANRLPDKITERIDRAVRNLGSDNFQEREVASAELLALEDVALPALQEATEQGDKEVVRRAEQLLETIRRTVPEDWQEFRDYDLIHTDKSQIAGTIDMESLRIHSLPFGEQQVKLIMVRGLQASNTKESEPTNVMNDPGTLSNYQREVGKTLYIRVTGGSRNGSVWGTGTYTLDSSLSMAAVHAGIVRAGETKVVAVKILGPANSFQGSTQNGVSTGDWAHYPGAYKLMRVGKLGRGRS